MITPTIGRKVWYLPRNQELAFMRRISEDQPFDATIVHVWNDRMVNLLVIDHNVHQHVKTSVPLIQEGDERPVDAGYAVWMPYQVGQAKPVRDPFALVGPGLAPVPTPGTVDFTKVPYRWTDEALGSAPESDLKAPPFSAT